MTRNLTLRAPKRKQPPPPPLDRLVYQTLYAPEVGHPRFGHFPADDLMIGVQFEVGGAYEDWGWAVYQKYYDEQKGCRTYRTVGSGRTLAAAVESAEQFLQKRMKKDG
jgi:hypothetical protein